MGDLYWEARRKEIKVKLSHYRPEQAHRVPGGYNQHMKVVGCQPYAPGVFTPRIILVLIFRG